VSLDSVDTPALLVDDSRLDRNIRLMAQLCQQHGRKLRPHIKTHKTLEIARRQRDSGAVGLTVAKLGEAEVYAAAGFDDLLVCYPIVGPLKLARLAALARRVTVSTVVDDAGAARELSAAMTAAGVRLDVLLKLDVGMHRVGVAAGEVEPLAAAVAALPGLRLRGVCIHEGSVYGEPDPARRRAVGRDQVQQLVATAERLRDRGLPIDVVSCGSTPSLADVIDIDGLTEVRPGNYVFYDAMQVALGVVEAERCALSVLTTVVSRGGADHAIVDAGAKTLSLDRGAHGLGLLADYGRIVGRDDVKLASLSEEHGWLKLSKEASLSVGERLRVLPNHACAVVNNVDKMTVVRDSEPVGEWDIAARGQVT
jgi:D-serine deaminase-like pyridoxal phosphate-dependent protein